MAPFHSKNPTDPDVHHDQSECPPGKLIPAHNKVNGTGNLRKCKKCIELG